MNPRLLKRRTHEPIVRNLRAVLAVCRGKGVRYWLTASLFAAVGWAASQALDTASGWRDVKYRAYMTMQNLRGGPQRVPEPVLVAIGDDDYYGPELEGRRPLKRDYLARLVTKIAAARPRLIALDIDFRSPVPDEAVSDFETYAEEDRLLFEALCAAQANTRIVISKALYADSTHALRADRNIYDGNTECPIPGNRIWVGYLNLPTDLRRVPLTLPLGDGPPADSFSLAAARALRPRQYPDDAPEVEHLPYGRFHSADEFTRIEASSVLKGTTVNELNGAIVIVYGDWHVLAKGRGASTVDSFDTPIGEVGGAFVHANLIETLLTAEYTIASPEAIGLILEVILAAFLAVTFAFPTGLRRKFSYLAATASAVFVGAWLSFQVFAVFFDVVPILAAMYLHAVADQVDEWRLAATPHLVSEET